MMAFQFLRSRWSYTRVLADETAGSGTSSSHSRPSLFAVLVSKQFRWAASTAVGLLLLTAVIHNFDRISAIGSASSSPTQHEASPITEPAAGQQDVDWSRFAYAQYVTDRHYLCNSVMFFERLDHLQSKADRVMMYPSKMLTDPQATEGSNDDATLLIRARDHYGAKLVPIAVQHRQGSDPTWADSFTKLLAFNQTQYDRVVSVDSDSTLLQHVDELFLLPPTPVAMPRAYWLYPDKQILSSQIMLVQPSESEFTRVAAKIDSAGSDDYDMEIVNQLYKDNAMVLPHRPYDLLTGEFSSDNHNRYLGNDEEIWDPIAVYNEAKLLHFSDWPMNKPWLDSPEDTIRQREPKCVMKDDIEDCSSRELWRGFYADFRARRKRVCDIERQRKPKHTGRHWDEERKRGLNF